MDCIFCKIVAGELPAYKIYEDKRFLAFLDINPVNKGHVLVIAKEHYQSFAETPHDVLKDLIVKIQDVSKAMTEALGLKGFNVVNNNGAVAGQLVEHLHFHIIPRLAGDNLHPWPGKTFSDEEMKRTAENISKQL
ncbi:MAG TPA: HIT family protein [Patescibacteria group bacterium]|nr:HIT family protein [Patescibacteria group bacterium]